jgi:hypothetical protein
MKRPLLSFALKPVLALATFTVAMAGVVLFAAALSAAAQTMPTAGPVVSPPNPPPVLILAPAPAPAALATKKPVFTIYLRERGNATDWFGAAPAAEEYGHGDSLLRISVAQRVHHFDYLAEISNSTELDLPRDAVSPVTAQGQLGLGGTYFAANGGNILPVAASFKQGFLRYHFSKNTNVLRLGRFEFFDGQETTPKSATMAWLQSNRIGQRLIGNFGFTTGQRSFDGIDLKVGGPNWDLTAMAGRADQGVFNMDANKELDVDIQYLAYSRYVAKQRVLFRAFGIGYHDGRPNITKTDNRTLAARVADHHNIRIGTYGGDMLALVPVHKETFDFLVWGAGQSGQWGVLTQKSGAIAIEGGLKLDTVASKPWLRGGYLRTTGDNNNTDGTHNTFFQLLPTPRVYARFPYFNSMNSTDEFMQLIDKPSPRVELRTDLHFLQLTAPTDLWYTGGGAFDSKVFGYTGRPGNNHSSFSSLYDLSADMSVSRQLSLTAYYAHSFGKTVVGTIFPLDRDANYGYIEMSYKLSKPFKK